jgi:hypothetical protein
MQSMPSWWRSLPLRGWPRPGACGAGSGSAPEGPCWRLHLLRLCCAWFCMLTVLCMLTGILMTVTVGYNQLACKLGTNQMSDTQCACMREPLAAGTCCPRYPAAPSACNCPRKLLRHHPTTGCSTRKFPHTLWHDLGLPPLMAAARRIQRARAAGCTLPALQCPMYALEPHGPSKTPDPALQTT